jgi:hypothetical protein
MLHILGIGYARSRAVARIVGPFSGPPDERGDKRTPEQKAAIEAFLAAMSPLWAWLLENADVTLACDSEDPESIWAWMVTSAPNVVHAVGCKRSLVEAGLSADVVRETLGEERLSTHQVCTLELPQMRTKGGVPIGLDRPRSWSLDPTWLLLRAR